MPSKRTRTYIPPRLRERALELGNGDLHRGLAHIDELFNHGDALEAVFLHAELLRAAVAILRPNAIAALRDLPALLRKLCNGQLAPHVLEQKIYEMIELSGSAIRPREVETL